MIGTGMGLWSFTFEYYANVLKAIAGDWNVDLPLPFVGDLWWLGVFSNEESGREFVFCSGAWPRAGSLAGTDVGPMGFRCFVLQPTISAAAGNHMTFEESHEQVTRTRDRLRNGAGPGERSRQRKLPHQLFFVKKDTCLLPKI